MEEILKFRHNVREISSIMDFEQIKGGFSQNIKEVYFIRLLGGSGTLLQEVEQMDARLSAAMAQNQCIYLRMSALPGLTGQTETAYYLSCYEQWKKSGERTLETKGAKRAELPTRVLCNACLDVLHVLQDSKGTVNDSIQKNFVVKLLFWLDQILKHFPQKWEGQSSIKIVADNVVRRQEYLFYYFLTLLGMDVLLIQGRQDIEPSMEQLGLSKSYRLGGWVQTGFPIYNYENYRSSASNLHEVSRQEANGQQGSAPVRITLPERNRKGKVETGRGRQENEPVRITLPERNRKGKVETERGRQENKLMRTSPPEQNTTASAASQAQSRPSSSQRREKTYEELALLSSSIVLIGIHDRRGEMIGVGSGIMIGRKGYILTNNHVATGGCFYSVRIEEEETVYETDQVIKYNPMLDLAVLRIDRTLQPLPIYSGSKKLVRGQRVVAIGSPLGLFNSVSDGIISGFRVINDVDMIQFTAPISHGSSGGALLNMYGEVIGISTAGFDEGQNINLATGYEGINLFIQGFVH